MQPRTGYRLPRRPAMAPGIIFYPTPDQADIGAVSAAAVRRRGRPPVRHGWPKLPRTLVPLFGVQPWSREGPCCHGEFPRFSPFFCPRCFKSGWDGHPDIAAARREYEIERRKKPARSRPETPGRARRNAG